MFRSASQGSRVSDFKNLPCIQRIFCDCYVHGRDSQGRCDPTKEYSRGNYTLGVNNPLAAGYEYLVDECIAIKLGDLKSPGYCGTFGAIHWETLRNKQRCRAGKDNSSSVCFDNNPLSETCKNNLPTSFVVLDSQCKSIPNATAESICGNFEAWTKWSPISLIWDGHAARSKRLVRFPLNPNAVDKVYEWHGSADMPLLVYDPTHSGEIRSATQLFGNWTWGGKRRASLSTTDLPADSAWKHGFEALAELDSNRNGKVDGGELAPLGLWFDRNQDGVSQGGEVISASSAGVTALFYSPDSDQKNPQEVVASIGFERMVDGRVVTGAAVDWFAHEAQSKGELALQQQLLNLEEPLSNEHLKKMVKDEQQQSSYAALAGNDRFAGAWKWKVRDESPDKGDGNLFGTLIIVTNPGRQEVTGHSVIEVPLVRGDGSDEAPHKLLAKSEIRGAFRKTKSGLELIVSVLDRAKVIAVSKIRVSPDGRKLLGTTTTGKSEQHGTLSYQWEAERY